jgi:hypothetical protein
MNESAEFRELSPDEVAALSPEERSDYIHRLMIWSGNRYRGNPELLLRENSRLDFSLSRTLRQAEETRLNAATCNVRLRFRVVSY